MELCRQYGRNGGLLRRTRKAGLVRVRQRQGFATYGAGFSLAEIGELTPSSYQESQIGYVDAKFFPKLIGAHHIHSNGKYSVYDYCKCENLYY